MGEDSRGKEFSSVEAFWKSELDGDNYEEKRSQWYKQSIQYWSQQEASVDGVLAGYESVSPVDLEASINFLDKIRNLPVSKGGPCQFSYALDCGAGVGRVTEGCLSKYFQKTDLLEPVNHLLDQARRNLSSNSKAGDFILSSLQDYAPPPQRYDCIWLQWCVLYLTDDDCVSFLKRCKPNLNPNGIICVKDNVVLDPSEGFHLDRDDNSMIRTDLHYKRLFEAAGLQLILEMRQPKYPKSLFPVLMYCLR